MIAAHCGDIEAQRAIVLYYAAEQTHLVMPVFGPGVLGRILAVYHTDLTGSEDELFLSAISSAYSSASSGSAAAKRCVRDL